MSGDHLERLEAALRGGRRVHHALGEPHPDAILVDEPDLDAAVAELKRGRADLEQSEAQVRTELSMSMEYRAERENAYALIARLRPDERFTLHVRQLLDVDQRGLRDPGETVAAVRVLLKSRDDDYAAASAASQQPERGGEAL